MQEKFWVGIGVGFISMLILSVIAAPVCALIGAFIAGVIVSGKPVNSVKAGIVIGILGIVLAFVTYFLDLVSVFGQMWGVIIMLGMPSILLSILVFFIISGIAGGAVGGLMKRYIPTLSSDRPDTG